MSARVYWPADSISIPQIIPKAARIIALMIISGWVNG
jgi:hypothetical protein